MRGAIGVIEFVLIIAIVISLTAFSYPWASKIIGEALDLGEISAVEPQFKQCSRKILETARTGTTNRCTFSISNGQLKGKIEGIEYSLMSTAPVCDPHPLIIIDEDSHIYQECEVSGENRVYKLLWMFPLELEAEGSGVEGDQLQGETPISNISFSDDPIKFLTLTLLAEFEYGPGESGNSVEITRKSLSSDKILMGVRIY